MPVGLEELQPELPSAETRRLDHLVGRLVEVQELDPPARLPGARAENHNHSQQETSQTDPGTP